MTAGTSNLNVVLRWTGSLIFTAILVHSSYHTLRLRWNPSREHMEKIVDEFLQVSHFKATRAQVAQEFHRVRSSRWLPLHVWFVPLWLALALTQNSAWLRRKSLSLHKIAGNLMLATSVLMVAVIWFMIVDGEEFMGHNDFLLDWRRPDKLFTVKSGSIVCSVYWLYCLNQLYQYARAKSTVRHRYWALQFLGTGLGVGTMRILSYGYLSIRFPKSAGVTFSKGYMDTVLGYSLWAGVILNLLVARLCSKMRKTRRN